MNIDHFLEKYGSEYASACDELDYQAVNASRHAITEEEGSLELLQILKENDWQFFVDRGMSKYDIEQLEIQLQELRIELPRRPGCLPIKTIVEYICDETSEFDNKKIYKHLDKCSACRKTLYEQAWNIRG
ncbi:hypothetical protein GF358_00190 [Candidatus Woesearchaeota archaeon]|nr:hypothetical protein [Candidatus Woesearchaeota archaeon]